jgi:hypothetical protein
VWRYKAALGNIVAAWPIDMDVQTAAGHDLPGLVACSVPWATRHLARSRGRMFPSVAIWALDCALAEKIRETRQQKIDSTTLRHNEGRRWCAIWRGTPWPERGHLYSGLRIPMRCDSDRVGLQGRSCKLVWAR